MSAYCHIPVAGVLDAHRAAGGAFDWAVSHMDFDPYALCRASGDFAAGMAAYLEKRPPHFTGR